MADYYLYRKKDKAGQPCGPYLARKRRKGAPDKYFNCETLNKAAAARRADEWHTRLTAARFGEAGPMTFAEACGEVHARHFPSLKHKTRMRYETVLALGKASFGATQLVDFDSGALADYEAKRRRAGAAPGTIGLEIRILGQVFKVAKRIKRFEGHSPCAAYLESAAADIRARVKREYYLNHKMEAEILSVASALWRARMVFALETGLRLEEWCSLTREQIDLRLDRVTVFADVSKNRTGRQVPLTPRAKEAYLWSRSVAPDSAYAFPKSDGARIAWNSASVWRQFQQFARAA